MMVKIRVVRRGDREEKGIVIPVVQELTIQDIREYIQYILLRC